jgi:ubiquinone/menaquinone biosynthesis C-methylase UbiE
MSDTADSTAPVDLPLPPPPQGAYQEAEARAASLIRAATGDDLAGHLVARLQARPGVRMLTIGQSAGAFALSLAQLAPAAEMVCVGVDAALAGSAAPGSNVQMVAGDLEALSLQRAAYDLIFCHAALHQVFALEAVLDQLRRGLRRSGAFVIVDVVTRSGYRMWPETRAVVDAIWPTLPARLRLNHTLYRAPLIDAAMWEPSPSEEDLQRSRSEQILRLIDSRFSRLHVVPYFSLMRRFFDLTYGPNYDLLAPLDKAVFDWIWQLDRHYVATGRLRPEVFFGIYRQA